MKKLFIISTAAILALAACSKTEVNAPSPDKAISFQVANYVSPVTKANVSFVTGNTFHNNSWVHTTLNGAPSTQAFMANEEVAWNSTEKQWMPARVYFWPKTGYVNFFSYAGSINPSATAEGSITYTEKTIDVDDDILVADAAYEYTGNVATYKIDDAGVTGVPTLFHHMLSKVTFNVKLDATDAIPSADYKWEVVVDESKFGYVNKGTAAFTFTDGESASVAAPVANVQTWNEAKDYAWTIVANNKDSELASTVIGEPNKMTATYAKKVSDVKTLFNEISVLPQDLVITPQNPNAWAQFALKYTIKSTYVPTSSTIEETVTIPLTDILSYVPSVTGWKMNYKYIYNIIIKPGEPVRFDPAVVDWSEETATDKII